ncbi:MAG: trypsin-like peptidase domain-containing protein, partial [Pseudolabrys sp.]
MNQLLPARAERKGFSARRLVLLASAAGLAIAAVAAAPSSFDGSKLPSFTTSARADSVQPSAGFADVVAKVKPAVISVRVKIDEAATTTAMGESDDGEANPRFPFEKFFEQFGRQGMPQAMPRGRQGVTGEGSGFFISADGYAVTNNHVVAGAKTVQVTTDDGAVYKAKVVGTDAKTD